VNRKNDLWVYKCMVGVQLLYMIIAIIWGIYVICREDVWLFPKVLIICVLLLGIWMIRLRLRDMKVILSNAVMIDEPNKKMFSFMMGISMLILILAILRFDENGYSLIVSSIPLVVLSYDTPVCAMRNDQLYFDSHWYSFMDIRDIYFDQRKKYTTVIFYTDRNRYGAKFHTDGLAYLKQVFDQKGLTYE
jgi:hypothetical protein